MNYILPVDTPELSFDYLNNLKSLRLDRVISQLEENASNSLIFIDACRNNPLGRSLRRVAGTRSGESFQGLAAINENDISTGTLISFATAPGQVASDGVGGRNSPYTAALKTAILTPGKDIGLILRGVRNKVRKATFDEQFPWYNVGLEDVIILKPNTSPAEMNSSVIDKYTSGIALDLTKAQPARSDATKQISSISPPSATITGFRSTSSICAGEQDEEQCVKPGRSIIVRDKRSNGDECSECPELVAVPSGTFTPAGATGAAARRGQREITRAFLISRHEISFIKWQACVKAGGCKGYRPNDNGWGRGNRPVIGVSFNDAEAYVRWLSKHTGAKYQLPTEAQWSYAALANAKTRWWWGNEPSAAKANFDASQITGANEEIAFRRQTVLVDAFEANAWGLKNVHGNVSEWTSSCFTKDTDPSLSSEEALKRAEYSGADCSKRIIRGGAWDSYARDTASHSREALSIETRSDRLGFRVIRILD